MVSRRLLVFLFLACSFSLQALPSGGQIVQGHATLIPSSKALEISANGKAILNWEQFNIASHEAVRFVQLQKSQAILNRVTSGSASEIFGTLQANCPIYLINPNGVFIGNSACIETAGFLASTTDLSNEAFWQGKELLFQGFGGGQIINLGKISAPQGDVFLIARKVVNEGRIEALNGMALLATCEIILKPDTKERVYIRMNEGAFEEEGIENSGALQALTVELRTCSPYEKAIYHSGSIEAVSTIEEGGRVYLIAESGPAYIDGTIKAVSGRVQCIAQTIDLDAAARLDVSGVSGGAIYLGTQEDHTLLATDVVHVSSGAELLAEGHEGNGGEVVVWAHSLNDFQGHISVQGYQDGGFVELSAVDKIIPNDVPNTRGIHGKNGHFLIDPAGPITITHSAVVTPFTDAYIEAQLAVGNFSIDTATDAPIAGTETLTINQNVSISWANSNSLTLIGGRNVIASSSPSTIQSTGGGSITISGGAVAAAASYHGIQLTGTTLQTNGDGTITLTGTSGTIGNNGINLSSCTLSTDMGLISLTGTAQTGSIRGIILNATSITSNKEISMTGSGGSTSIGIDVTSASQVSSPAGIISMQGTGGTTGTGCTGIRITGANTNVTSATGSIEFIGQGGGTTSLNHGVQIASQGTVSSTGTATIDIQGTGGAATLNNYGIQVTGTGSKITSLNGSVTLTGMGGSGNKCDVIEIDSGGTVSSTGTGSSVGKLILNGTGPTVGYGDGIYMTDSGSIVTSVDGDIELSGTGQVGSIQTTGVNIRVGSAVTATGTGSISLTGIGSSSSTSLGRGVVVADLNSHVSTNTGTITIQGTGKGTAGGGGGNQGFQMGGNAFLQSNGGDISCTGTGGGGATNCVGVILATSSITTTDSGKITLKGTGSDSGSSSAGIFLASSCTVTSVDGAINLEGQGGGTPTGNTSEGIIIQTSSKISTTTGSITCQGTGGSGTTSTEGVLLSGTGSQITSTGGAIEVTGTGGGTGTLASGVSLSGGRITNTNAGTIKLTGTASPTGSTGNSGILISGTQSAVISDSGTITLTATGNGSGSNTGLRVTSAGQISSTSGSIQTASPHAQGGSGVNNCYGIFVDGSGSLITSGTGSINLTGIGNGTGTTGRGIQVSTSAAITTTSNAPITLMGTGSTSGTSSNEGIFLTGTATAIRTATGAIQMTGIAGGGTTNGITVDTGATVASTAAGLVILTSTNNNIAVQNNSSIKTQGSGGPGINDISIASQGLTVTGGASGSAVISTTNGNIGVVSSGLVSISGSTVANSLGQITVGNSVNTIHIESVGLSMTGGSGSSAFAEISAAGGLISIDGAGAISLTGGTSTTSPAQIINRTNVPASNAIRIGAITPPTTLTLQGGLAAGGAPAFIASNVGGHIVCTTSGALTITGGSGTADARAGIITGLSSGTGNILATAGAISITGGSGASPGLNYAGLFTGLAGGSGDITLTAASYSLTGGASGSGYNSAEILTPALGSGNITLTSGANPIQLQGGGGAISNARIATAGSGNINITGTGSFSALGGSGASSFADVNAQGTLTIDMGAGNYILTGNAGDSSYARFTAIGTVNLTGGNYTLTGGVSGVADGSNAVIESTGMSGLVTLTGGNITLNGGTAASQHSYIQTTAGSGTNPIDITCSSLNLHGSGVSNGSIEVRTVLGDVDITASGNITLTAGSASQAVALIQSTAQGKLTLDAQNVSVQAGSLAGSSGIVTQSGDISITCTQNASLFATAPNALAVVQTFGSDVTMIMGGSIDLVGTSISTPAPTGNLLLIAGVNITIDGTTEVTALGTMASSLTLVVDNNFPTSPGIGPGAFILDAGGILSTETGMPLKIYTAVRDQNTMNSPINGDPFIPGPLGVDTSTEEWEVYYPGGSYEGAAFKFYYKATEIPPPSPNPFPLFDLIAANLVELAYLLPVLDVNWYRYHFQLCEKDRRRIYCSPIFSPYGSFIFEDDLFWIGTAFTTGKATSEG